MRANPRWMQGATVPFVNTSGETMPPYGVGAVVKQVSRYGIEVYEIEKPGTTLRRQYLLNGPKEVAASGRGLGYAAGGDRRAAFDTGTPVEREGYGVKNGQWTLTKGGLYIFEIGKVDDATNKWAFGTFSPFINSVFGKLDGTLSAGSTATLSIWAGPEGSEVDTTANVTIRDWLMKSGDSVASGKKVRADWMGSAWYLTQAECA